MAMRLQEVHPSVVHFPIALLPTSLVSDAIGRLTDNQKLMDLGKMTMPLAAGSGLLAGLWGIVAQQTVELNEQTTKMLVTHRNLNIGAVAAACGLAWVRSRSERPGWGYLAAGFATVGAVVYSAYLGGHMVYEHGVGVKPAGGVKEEAAPRITPRNLGHVIRLTGRHLGEGLQLTAEETAEGKLAPWITSGDEAQAERETEAKLAEAQHQGVPT